MFDSTSGLEISLPIDEHGFIGRECPIEDCEGYFKIKLGTGIKDEGYEKCYCPYCGFESIQDVFFTKDQISYIKSMAVREAGKLIEKKVKRWDKNLRLSTRNSIIKLRVDYKSSNRPFVYYAEKELETHITCENCKLEYAIFGKFSYCPDCGIDNTLQIFKTNLALVHKFLSLAKAEKSLDLKESIIHNALVGIVSAFDSFGRNCLRLFTMNYEKKDLNISFQKIINTHEKIFSEFGFNFLDCLNDKEKKMVVRNFQKRHLITHNDGIVDCAYIKITNDSEAVLGRKISVTEEDIKEMLSSIEIVAQSLQSGFSKWKISIT